MITLRDVYPRNVCVMLADVRFDYIVLAPNQVASHRQVVPHILGDSVRRTGARRLVGAVGRA